MAKDLFNRPSVTNSFSFNRNERDSGYKIRGEIFWTLKNSVSGEETCGHLMNTVTLDAGVLIARLMKNPLGTSFGVYALAVGTGDVGWDPMNPPSANTYQRSLCNEIARKAASSSQFIDSNGLVSSIPTNIVDFSFTFSESEAVGPLTEMGLVGGDISSNMSIRNPVLPPNGTYDPTVDLTGVDTLCNYLTFPVINKPITSSMNLTYRLTF